MSGEGPTLGHLTASQELRVSDDVLWEGAEADARVDPLETARDREEHLGREVLWWRLAETVSETAAINVEESPPRRRCAVLAAAGRAIPCVIALRRTGIPA